MAQYYTDFSEYTTGGVPSDWSLTWDATSSDWQVVEDAAATGGKYLEFDSSNSFSILTWDAADGVSDVEIVFSVTMLDTHQFGRSVNGVVRGYGDPSGNDRNWYELGRDFNDSDVLLQEQTSGNSTDLASETRTDGVLGEFYFVRLRANGTNIKAKAWKATDSEPSAWDFEVTDSGHNSGFAGLYLYSPQEGWTTQYDEVGIGTEGDTAPTEPVSADPPAAPTNLQLSEQ